MRTKLLLLAPLLLATAAVVWAALALPPPLWIVKYGLAPGCEPGGEVVVEGVPFVVVGPGCFRMGTPPRDRTGALDWRILYAVGIESVRPGDSTNEMPAHWVEFPRGFAIARTEITNAQYEAFDADHGRNPRSSGDRDPVVDVNWDDAKAYCAWLAEKSGRSVRLPSEAEWECACRAGGTGDYTFGDDAADLGEHAWYWGNSDGLAHEVGAKMANAWGLCDLHGNVWEWCEDRFHDSYVVTGPVVQPDGTTLEGVLSRAPTDGTAWLHEKGVSLRTRRGGSWYDGSAYCRTALRIGVRPEGRSGNLGFRPAMGD